MSKDHNNWPEMPERTCTSLLREVEGPVKCNTSRGQIAMNARAAAWRKIANERLAHRRRVNGGYSKGSH